MTAHDLATGTSWAVIDRPYNSDASRLFLSMSAHSKFLEIWRSGDLELFQPRSGDIPVATGFNQVSTGGKLCVLFTQCGTHERRLSSLRDLICSRHSTTG